MLKNSFIALLVLAFGVLLFHGVVKLYKVPEKLNRTAEFYNSNEASQIGAANVVTAVVVTYRGLDTLGEVTVLFLAASVIGFFLKRKKKTAPVDAKPAGSELMTTASKVLVPGSIILGVYVFVNGHLTPGGGFQGGAIIGTAILLLALANPTYSISKKVFHWIESISGFVFVAIGLAGLLLAGGFLDTRFLPNGEMLSLFSAGAIPLIYSMIGLKVGSEISGIILELNDTQPNQD
jgi:multicomponent Na+:H+ antiporter subunit B